MTVKGSRFIGIIMSCLSEDQIQANLRAISEKYRDATHYCYAAVFDGSDRKEKSSDNGEPSGTAGKPILSVLRGSELSDVMCVVIRYFGGTLLGTGGLVHAYTETAKMAMEKVDTYARTACAVYRFTLDYGYYSAMESKCRDLMVCNPVCEFTDKVDIVFRTRICDEDEFIRRITDLTERHVILKRMGDEYVCAETDHLR